MSLLFVDFYYLLYYFIGKYCFLVGYQTVEMSSLILFGMFCMHFYFFNYCCFYFVFLYEIHSLLNAIVNYWSLQIFPCFCRLDVKQFGMNINVFCHLWGDVSFKKNVFCEVEYQPLLTVSVCLHFQEVVLFIWLT